MFDTALTARGLLRAVEFAAFRSSKDERAVTVRTITRVVVEPLLGSVISIAVEGSAFMHNMVRIIVGALLDVARGRLAAGALGRALASGRRSDLGMTAPAAGLYLEYVEHTLALDDVWPLNDGAESSVI